MNRITLANGTTIALQQGDITAIAADAIVNAANAYLAAGGGVSGAIHRAAGPSLADECAEIALKRGPLKIGESVITGGYDLPARHVIHALGPVWSGGDAGEQAALAKTYREAVAVADENGLRSIAFPSISTGIFGYPVELAAPVAIDAVASALLSARSVREAVFVLVDRATFEAFSSALQQVG